MYKPEFNSAKFRELVLYISGKDIHSNYGFTELIATLFYSDFMSFVYNDRKSITNATYEKLSMMPYPREFPEEVQALVDNGKAYIERNNGFNVKYGHFRESKIALVPKFPVPKFPLVSIAFPPDLSDAFSDNEKMIINDVYNQLRYLNRSEIVSLLQNEIGWQVTSEGETIPYETAFLIPSGDIDAWIDAIPTGKKIIKERQL